MIELGIVLGIGAMARLHLGICVLTDRAMFRDHLMFSDRDRLKS